MIITITTIIIINNNNNNNNNNNDDDDDDDDDDDNNNNNNHNNMCTMFSLITDADVINTVFVSKRSSSRAISKNLNYINTNNKKRYAVPAPPCGELIFYAQYKH